MYIFAGILYLRCTLDCNAMLVSVYTCK